MTLIRLLLVTSFFFMDINAQGFNNRQTRVRTNLDQNDRLGGLGLGLNPNLNTIGLEEPLESVTLKCPTNWVTNEESCYKFVRSPKKTRDQARRQCQVCFLCANKFKFIFIVLMFCLKI